MSRLIWVFAGRTVTLLVLSCRGSYVFMENWRKLSFSYHQIPSLSSPLPCMTTFPWTNEHFNFIPKFQPVSRVSRKRHRVATLATLDNSSPNPRFMRSQVLGLHLTERDQSNTVPFWFRTKIKTPRVRLRVWRKRKIILIKKKKKSLGSS